MNPARYTPRGVGTHPSALTRALRTLLFAAAFASWNARVVQSQGPVPPTLDSGTLVRVRHDGRTEVGRLLMRWEPASPTLFLCRSLTRGCHSLNDTAAVWLPHEDLLSVQPAAGRRARYGALVGTAIGFLVGSGVALLVSGIECSDCGPQPSPLPIIPAGAVTFGLLGAAIGWLHPGWGPALRPDVGRLTERSASTPIPLPPRNKR